MSNIFLADTTDTTVDYSPTLYNICDSALFSALHDQLASYTLFLCDS